MKIKYKRLVAYIIDFILISFFVSLLAGSGVLNKAMDKYYSANERLEEKYDEILGVIEGKDKESNLDETMLLDVKAIVYDINDFGNVYYAIEILAMIGYFVLFQYFNKGQTLGKKIMKIRIVDKEEQPISLGNLLLRAVLLYGILFNIITMIGVEVLNVNSFYILYVVVNLLKIVFTYAIYFMILFRKDEKGLHDLLASSKVIEVTS